ncbi:hypothetical protein BC829DRAFT_129435 [Chytridium lagenaria]|nr:hypothetical protein BC829DRAFT_129435 [Chytridium lagenaria]
MRPTTLFVLLVLAFCQISGVFSNPLPRKPYPPETLRNPWISSRNTYATKYRAMRVWFEGRRGWCFRFNGDSGRTTATVDGSNARTGTVIFPRYQDGKSAGFPIFDKIPTDQGYSDAWSAKVVVVPGWYKPNRVRNVEALIASGFPQSVVGVYNFALVPKGSKLVDWNNKEISTSIRNGWYKGNRVRYFDFGAIQIDAQSVAVPLSNAFVVVDSKGPKGSPIFSSIPGPGPYTGFYSLKTYRVADSIAADSIRSPPPVDDPNVTKEGIALNCPLVFVEQAALDPTKPIPKPPTSIGTLPKPAIPPAKSNSYFNGPPAYFTTVPVFYNNRAALYVISLCQLFILITFFLSR